MEKALIPNPDCVKAQEALFEERNSTEIRMLLTPPAQYISRVKEGATAMCGNSPTSTFPHSLWHGLVLPTSASSENKSQLAFFQHLKSSFLKSLQARAEDPQNTAMLWHEKRCRWKQKHQQSSEHFHQNEGAQMQPKETFLPAESSPLTSWAEKQCLAKQAPLAGRETHCKGQKEHSAHIQCGPLELPTWTVLKMTQRKLWTARRKKWEPYFLWPQSPVRDPRSPEPALHTPLPSTGY